MNFHEAEHLLQYQMNKDITIENKSAKKLIPLSIFFIQNHAFFPTRNKTRFIENVNKTKMEYAWLQLWKNLTFDFIFLCKISCANPIRLTKTWSKIDDWKGNLKPLDCNKMNKTMRGKNHSQRKFGAEQIKMRKEHFGTH